MKLYLVITEYNYIDCFEAYPTNAIKTTREEAQAICDYMNDKLGNLYRSDCHYYIKELDTDDVTFDKERQAPEVYYQIRADLETREIDVYDCGLEPTELVRDSVVIVCGIPRVEVRAFSKEDAIHKAIDIFDDWLREEKEKAANKIADLATDGSASEEDLRKAIDYSKDILDLTKSLRKEI